MAIAAPAAALEWHLHPDVWLMVVALAGGYVLALRAWGRGEEPVPTRKKAQFAAGVAFLWLGADWPIHEISEEYLFSIHMVQHTLFSLVAPPLLLMGIPAWVFRRLFRNLGVTAFVRAVTRPLPALLLFNTVIVVTHWPALVDFALTHELAHFGVHVVLVGASLAMWWPVIEPLPEMASLSPPAKLFYLFLQSIVPTVPASFLTFSDTAIYDFYANAPRLWGIGAVDDQRTAGLIMKIGGGLLLWAVITVRFFKWQAREESKPADEPEELTWEDFERELQVWELRR